MSLFRGSGRLEQKLAQNNDPMKQKKLWVKSFYCAAVLAALGLFFLLAMGSQFTVFACVLLGCAAFVCRWPGDQKPQIIPLREVLLRFSFLKITRTNVSRETFLSFAFYGEEKILRRCYTKSGFLGEVHYGSDPYWFIFGGAAP